jgi:hypothetical protein
MEWKAKQIKNETTGTGRTASPMLRLWMKIDILHVVAYCVWWWQWRERRWRRGNLVRQVVAIGESTQRVNSGCIANKRA